MKMYFILIIIFIPIISYATVDCLHVNHLTKELYWFDDNDYYGINWQSLGAGDDKLIKLERYYLDNGYKYTKFPYKIEFLGIIIVFTIASIIITIIIIRKNIKIAPSKSPNSQ
ncbi:MAG: hypothetical protein A2086_11065 [Spirochaetes bacterium GWD1_27_9]|nr:MAG: hypothetical protein A2Z98_03210 [Spirochaetes bacterium GWB1_27_13]OHD26369.1 MAG: hypothetical protein A2Y34_05735 [Spirochaetes bacterium GWC1_27_15]OHD42109.1 MAG: hypothetical protein A2086_11065 [Spirochaetes bacterium GWD1_27_9]